MISVKKTIDKISHYLYNVSVGCTVYMFFNFNNLSLFLTVITFFCAMWLSLLIENNNTNN